jgi:hypothetical protein
MGPHSKLKRVLSEVEIPWEDAVKKRFPFVSKQTGMWPKRTTVEALQELLSPEEMAEEALEVLAKASPEGRKSKS